jgi:hypothetical protein
MGHWILILSFFLTQISFADVNDCDDYLLRHYRKDLVLTKISFVNKTHMGDINFPHQQIKLFIKNKGEIDFNSIPTDNGQWRDLYVRINGILEKTRFKIPLDSDQSTIVYTNLKPSSLKRCSKTTVQIDVGHTAKQWGCQVWNNDTKTLPAHEGNNLCRFIF